MGPVHHTPPIIPLINTGKLNTVAFIKRIHSRREIDIVRDQYGMAGIQTNDEPLMPAAVKIIRKQSYHLSFTPYP